MLEILNEYCFIFSQFVQNLSAGYLTQKLWLLLHKQKQYCKKKNAFLLASLFSFEKDFTYKYNAQAIEGMLYAFYIFSS